MNLIGPAVATDRGIAARSRAVKQRHSPHRILAIPLSLAVLVVPISSAAAGRAGSLDKTFGLRGRVETDFGARDGATDVAITATGSILVVGQTYSGGSFGHGDIALYRPHGRLDRRFSGNGKLRVAFQSGAVAIATRHRFLVAGPSKPGSSEPGLIVAGYRFNGRPDESFGSNGVVTVADAIGFATDMIVLPDRSLLVLTQFGLWRLRPSGRVDTDFGTNGQAVAPSGTELYDLALQPNERIVVGATSGGAASLRLRVVRFRPGGKLDTSFAGDGVSNAVDVLHSATWAGVGVQSSGKIVLAGVGTVARFTAHGSLDRSFGSDGIAPGYFLDEINDNVFALLIQPDDKIVLLGQTVGPREAKPLVFGVARLSPGGRRDRSFSDDGIAITPFSRRYAGARGAALDARGRILAVGAAGPPGVLGDFALARYSA